MVEPATGRELGTVGRASLADVEQAANLAAQAQQTWSQIPFDERADPAPRRTTLGRTCRFSPDVACPRIGLDRTKGRI